MEQRIIKVASSEDTAAIFGSYDVNVRAVEQTMGVSIRNRATDDGGDSNIESGEDREQVNKGAAVIEYLADMIKYSQLSEQSVRYVIDMVDSGKARELAELGDDCICVTTKGKPIKAKTVGQKQYVEAIRKNTIILGVGPAGT
ncbi:MAG: PhoH family protein, partial [Clostridia bacterium]|nr:PhoH family protein [Clostridia bacterium]